MIIALVLCILFLVGAIHNLVIGSYDEAAAGIAIALALNGLFMFSRYQEKQTANFMAWLHANKEQLKNDSRLILTWNGIPLKYDSYVTQYHLCVSFVIITFREPTNIMLEESSNRFLVNIVACILTFIFGWWGIPWGPIYTVQALLRNFRGGTQQHIADLITELEDAEKKAERTRRPTARRQSS